MKDKKWNPLLRTESNKRERVTLSKKTIAYIICPFLTGVAFALSHYGLFQYLDEKPIEDAPFKQSFVTTVSLLFVSGFRMFMVASVAFSFTQHLWRVLRDCALPVFRIEQLFNMRTSPHILANPRVLWATPLLFSMMVYVWFIEIAVVYPPGALTVALRPFPVTRATNISVVNQPLSEIYDPQTEPEKPYPLLYEILQSKDPIENSNSVVTGTPFFKGFSVTFRKPLASLNALAKYILVSGERVDLPPPEGQNLSYSLQFRAPQLSCSEEKLRNVSMTLNATALAPSFNSTWDGNDTYTLVKRHNFGFYHYTGDANEIPFTEDDAEIFVLAEQSELICKTVSMRYDLNISYTNGIQQVDYSIKDEQPFKNLYGGEFIALDIKEERYHSGLNAVVWGEDFDQWPGLLNDTLASWNEFSIADSTLSMLSKSWTLGRPQSEMNIGTFTLENGTEVELRGLRDIAVTFKNIVELASQYCNNINSWQCGYLENVNKGFDIFQDSILDPSRFNDALKPDDSTAFDPRNLTITEATLNDLLTNITISTLSIGYQHAMVPITVLEYRNIYLFSDLPNFIIPYAVCSLFALVYVVVGIRALARNGVSATDGGFLQIMMATRGRTEMESLVLKKGFVATNHLPKELLDMRLRLGELVATGDGGRSTGAEKRTVVAFGTTEETIALERRGKRRTSMLEEEGR